MAQTAVVDIFLAAVTFSCSDSTHGVIRLGIVLLTAEGVEFTKSAHITGSEIDAPVFTLSPFAFLYASNRARRRLDLAPEGRAGPN